MTAPINLLDLTPAEALARLREFATATGEPAYRAAQVVRHLWEKPVAGFRADDDVAGGAPRMRSPSVRDPAPRARSRGRSRPTARRSFSSACPKDRRSRRSRSPRRAADALHLVAGRVRAAMRVLRDGRDGLPAQPRSRARSPAQVREMRAARPADRGHEHRVHGDGRADDELEGGRPRAHDPQRSAGARHRRAAHHGLDGRRAARHRRARRAPGTVPPRDLDPRADRRAAARADADQHQVSAGAT